MLIPQEVPPSNVASGSSNSNICAQTPQRTAGAETSYNVASSSSNSNICAQINETPERTSRPSVMRPHKNRKKKSQEDYILEMARKEHNLKMVAKREEYAVKLEILQIQKKSAIEE